MHSKNSRLVVAGGIDRLLETENEGIIDELILLNSLHVGKIKYQESYWERLNVEEDGEVEWNKEVRREAGNEVACIFKFLNTYESVTEMRLGFLRVHELEELLKDQETSAEQTLEEEIKRHREAYTKYEKEKGTEIELLNTR